MKLLYSLPVLALIGPSIVAAATEQIEFDCTEFPNACKNMCWGRFCRKGRIGFADKPIERAAPGVNAEHREKNGYKVPSQGNICVGDPKNFMAAKDHTSMDEWPFASFNYQLGEDDAHSVGFRCMPQQENSKAGARLSAKMKVNTKDDPHKYTIKFINTKSLGVDWCDVGRKCKNDGYQFSYIRKKTAYMKDPSGQSYDPKKAARDLSKPVHARDFLAAELQAGNTTQEGDGEHSIETNDSPAEDAVIGADDSAQRETDPSEGEDSGLPASDDSGVDADDAVAYFSNPEEIVERDEAGDVELLSNTTLADGASSYDEDGISGLEKRNDESPFDCARRLQPEWPSVRLTIEQAKACVPTATTTDLRRRGGEKSAMKDTFKKGDLELGKFNCGDGKISKYFVDNITVKKEAPKICQKLIGWDDNPTQVPPPMNIEPEVPFLGRRMNMVGGHTKEALSFLASPKGKLKVALVIMNYGIYSNPENTKLAIGLCEEAIKQVAGKCVSGLGGIGAKGGSRQVQRAFTATWNDVKTKAPKIAFDYTFPNVK